VSQLTGNGEKWDEKSMVILGLLDLITRNFGAGLYSGLTYAEQPPSAPFWTTSRLPFEIQLQ